MSIEDPAVSWPPIWLDDDLKTHNKLNDARKSIQKQVQGTEPQIN